MSSSVLAQFAVQGSRSRSSGLAMTIGAAASLWFVSERLDMFSASNEAQH